MKKTNLNAKLAGASAMLLLSASMLGTSTYAWFTMNKEVTITGMEVKTHVGSNLLIQKSTLNGTALEGEGGFVTDELQEIKRILEPVSTIDGQTFFYTLDAKADGSKLHDPIGTDDSLTINYTAYDISAAATGDNASNYANKFSQDYELTTTAAGNIITGETGAYGYVDYVFQLKATNTEAAVQYINLNRVDLTYAGETETDKAWRAAVFVVNDGVDAGGTFNDWSSAIATTGTGAASLKTILTPSGAANFSNGNAVSDVDARDAVTYNTAANLATVPANSVKYYKVVVRLWIEGEDTTCNTSTYKTLTDAWTLDLTMDLESATGGATSITMAQTPASTNP
jgi:hypothetical protein